MKAGSPASPFRQTGAYSLRELGDQRRPAVAAHTGTALRVLRGHQDWVTASPFRQTDAGSLRGRGRLGPTAVRLRDELPGPPGHEHWSGRRSCPTGACSHRGLTTPSGCGSPYRHTLIPLAAYGRGQQRVDFFRPMARSGFWEPRPHRPAVADSSALVRHPRGQYERVTAWVSPDGASLASGLRRLRCGCGRWRRGGVPGWLVARGSWAVGRPTGGIRRSAACPRRFWHVIGLCRFEVGELDEFDARPAPAARAVAARACRL